MRHKQHCSSFCLIRDLGIVHTKDRHDLIASFKEPRTWSAYQLIKKFEHTHTSTIYRTIRMLLTHGLIREASKRKEKTYYEWAKQGHHDHLTCEHCDIVECIPCQIPNKKNHVLEITDLCSSCK